MLFYNTFQYNTDSTTSQPKIRGQAGSLSGIPQVSLANRRKVCYTIKVCQCRHFFVVYHYKENSLEVIINGKKSE